MKHSAAVLAAFFFLAPVVSARAATSDLEFYVGGELYAQCSADMTQPGGAEKQARCAGYVMGVSDALQAVAGAGGKPVVCLPATATQPQLVDTVRHFLEVHPEKHQLAAQDLVREALGFAYSCR